MTSKGCRNSTATEPAEPPAIMWFHWFFSVRGAAAIAAK